MHGAATWSNEESTALIYTTGAGITVTGWHQTMCSHHSHYKSEEMRQRLAVYEVSHELDLTIYMGYSGLAEGA